VCQSCWLQLVTLCLAIAYDPPENPLVCNYPLTSNWWVGHCNTQFTCHTVIYVPLENVEIMLWKYMIYKHVCELTIHFSVCENTASWKMMYLLVVLWYMLTVWKFITVQYRGRFLFRWNIILLHFSPATRKSSYCWQSHVTLVEAPCSLSMFSEAVICIWHCSVHYHIPVTGHGWTERNFCAYIWPFSAYNTLRRASHG